MEHTGIQHTAHYHLPCEGQLIVHCEREINILIKLKARQQGWKYDSTSGVTFTVLLCYGCSFVCVVHLNDILHLYVVLVINI